MSHYRGSYSVNIPDNQKELNRRDQNGLQLKRENEANLAKIKQLTADLQAAQDEMQNQAKVKLLFVNLITKYRFNKYNS